MTFYWNRDENFGKTSRDFIQYAKLYGESLQLYSVYSGCLSNLCIPCWATEGPLGWIPGSTGDLYTRGIK